MEDVSPQSPIVPLILAGGTGTRLWPLSTDQNPKQFLKLGGSQSLLNQTLARLKGHGLSESPILIGSTDHASQFLEAVKINHPTSDILLEPVGRNSCAAIIAGALYVLERNSDDALVFAIAADHIIVDDRAFRTAITMATPAARAGQIVTFGIKPRYPATGYGYILPGDQISDEGVARIVSFVEKPDVITVERYISNGYLWNSGNFLFSAKSLIDEATRLVPDVVKQVALSLQKAERRDNAISLNEDFFSAAPAVSFDVAIMEKTNRASVLPVDYQWTDIGTWDAIAKTIQPAADGNTIMGKGVVHRGKNTFIYSEDILTTVIGCDDIIVVTTPEAVLVVKKGESENVKALVDRLRSEGHLK